SHGANRGKKCTNAHPRAAALIWLSLIADFATSAYFGAQMASFISDTGNAKTAKVAKKKPQSTQRLLKLAHLPCVYSGCERHGYYRDSVASSYQPASVAGSSGRREQVCLYQFFGPGRVLSRTHPGYEFRRRQLQMAEA